MGAFDCVYAPYQCPSCGAHHDGDWQSKFFDPDFFTRLGDSFYLNQPVKVLLDIQDLQRTIAWDGSWLALTPWKPDAPLALVSDQDDWLYCSCGSQAIPCFYFLVREAGTLESSVKLPSCMVTLQEVRCMDPSMLDEINFIDAERLGDLKALAALSLEERRERFLQQIKTEPFWLPEPGTETTSSMVVGPVRCNQCQEIRRRFLWCGHELMQPGLSMKVGDHRPTLSTPDTEPRLLPLRDEEPHDSLALLFPESWSCACSPDTKMFSLLCYSHEGDGLRLLSIELTLLTNEVLDRATHVAPSILLSSPYAYNEAPQWVAASPAQRREALRQKLNG